MSIDESKPRLIDGGLHVDSRGIIAFVNSFDFKGVDNFFIHGMLDSFDLVMLVAALEKHYNIVIDGEDIVLENFYNVEAIIRLITKYGVTI